MICCAGCADRAAPDARDPERYAWRDLFDGESLTGWRHIGFDGDGGAAEVADGKIVFGRGRPFTGLTVADPDFDAPAEEYEVAVRARKIDGRDFFCALTFPVPEKGACCTFVAGGWGGGVTGLSNIDGLDANRNTTRAALQYQTGRWYDLRVEVRRGRIRCWVDRRLVVNALIADRQISMRPGAIEACQPLGVASYETAAEIETIRVRALPPEDG